MLYEKVCRADFELETIECVEVCDNTPIGEMLTVPIGSGYCAYFEEENRAVYEMSCYHMDKYREYLSEYEKFKGVLNERNS